MKFFMTTNNLPVNCVHSLKKSLKELTLKEPFTTAADNKFCDIFLNFQKK